MKLDTFNTLIYFNYLNQRNITIVNWMIENGLIEPGDDISAKHLAQFLFFLATAKTKEDVTPIPNNNAQIIKLLEYRLWYHKQSGLDIFDLKEVRISTSRCELEYNSGDVAWIGEETHTGKVTAYPGEWVRQLREKVIINL